MQLLTSDVICLETTFGKMFERYLLNMVPEAWVLKQNQMKITSLMKTEIMQDWL